MRTDRTRILNSGEASLIATNLREIERAYGKPLPSGLLDASSYGDHLLTPKEASIIASNLREIERRRHPSSYHRSDYSTNSLVETVEFIAGAAMLLIGVIAYFFF